jgi:hypothetical protein
VTFNPYDSAVFRLRFPTRSPSVTTELLPGAQMHAYAVAGQVTIEVHVPREAAILAQLPAMLTVGAVVDVLPEGHIEPRQFLACRVARVDPQTERAIVTVTTTGRNSATPTFSAWLTWTP